MSERTFTGERLHPDDALFGVDLAQHRAAYRFALERARGGRVLELGSGAGYGAAELAREGLAVTALDRVAPLRSSRADGARYVRADVAALPLLARSFDLVVSFQVIEHLDDPTRYLEAISSLLRPDGTAYLTTPNVVVSDRVNPFHVHEYESDELRERLTAHFGEVEMLGVGAGPRVAPYFEERLARIRRIMRLDPLQLRDRLPRSLLEWLFGRFALLVRRDIQQGGMLPDSTIDDFPIGPADPAQLDLLAVCRQPLRG